MNCLLFLAACVCVCVNELEDAGVTDSVLISHTVPGLHATPEGEESRSCEACRKKATLRFCRQKRHTPH